MGRCWSSPLRHKRLLNESDNAESKKRSASRSCNCRCRHSLAAPFRDNAAFLGEDGGVELGKILATTDFIALQHDNSTSQSNMDINRLPSGLINDVGADIADMRHILLQLQVVLQSADRQSSGMDNVQTFHSSDQQSSGIDNVQTFHSNANLSLIAEVEQLRRALIISRDETQRAIAAKASAETLLHQLEEHIIQSESFRLTTKLAALNDRAILSPQSQLRSSFANFVSEPFDEHHGSPTGTTFPRYLMRQQFDRSNLKNIKLLYFTERVVTPFMATLTKDPKELCLADVRRATQHTQPYHRFLFKRHDSRFGTIKQEVRYDHDPVPLWNGKIVAWIFCDSASLECVD